MEERKLKATERIKQLAADGDMIEIELRDKADSLHVGKLAGVGDDYVEFIREVKSETTQKDDDDSIVTIFNLTTIVLLADIQAFTVLKEGTKVRQEIPIGKING